MPPRRGPPPRRPRRLRRRARVGTCGAVRAGGGSGGQSRPCGVSCHPLFACVRVGLWGGACACGKKDHRHTRRGGLQLSARGLAGWKEILPPPHPESAGRAANGNAGAVGGAPGPAVPPGAAAPARRPAPGAIFPPGDGGGEDAPWDAPGSSCTRMPPRRGAQGPGAGRGAVQWHHGVLSRGPGPSWSRSSRPGRGAGGVRSSQGGGTRTSGAAPGGRGAVERRERRGGRRGPRAGAHAGGIRGVRGRGVPAPAVLRQLPPVRPPPPPLSRCRRLHVLVWAGLCCKEVVSEVVESMRMKVAATSAWGESFCL